MTAYERMEAMSGDEETARPDHARTIAELVGQILDPESERQMWREQKARGYERLSELDDLAVARLAAQGEADEKDVAAFLPSFFGILGMQSPTSATDREETRRLWLQFASLPMHLRQQVCKEAAAIFRREQPPAKEEADER